MESEISLIYKISDQPDYFKDHAQKYFSMGAETLLMKQNPKKALRLFDRGIVLLPNDRSLLALRGLARFELGDKDGAVRDWTRIKNLGGLEDPKYIENYYKLDGFEQMTMALEK